MANTIKTVITYVLDDSTRDFNIPFEYLARKFIAVTLIGADRKVLTLGTDYRFSSKSIISTNQAWGAAEGYYQIEFRRFTSASERLADFADGSILRAYDLNVAQIQSMHIAEEARDLTADTIGENNDGQLDARGRRIVNVADAVADGDALNLRTAKLWNESGLSSANIAKAHADSSAISANRSKAYADSSSISSGNSKAYADSSAISAKHSEDYAGSAHQSADNAYEYAKNAGTFSDSAWQYQDWGKGYKEAAESSANIAKAHADSAAISAEKLGNLEGFSDTIEVVNGPDVVFKGLLRAQQLQLMSPPNTLLYNMTTEGTTFVVSSEPSTVSSPLIEFRGIPVRARSLEASSGLMVLRNGSSEFNVQLSGATVQANAAGVSLFSFGDVAIGTNKTISGPSYWIDTNGDIKSSSYAGGSTMAALNSKVSAADASTTYLVDITYGTRRADALNNYPATYTFEVPAGYSLTGWLATTGDGSIRYTTWLSRALYKRTATSGWIQCLNMG